MSNQKQTEVIRPTRPVPFNIDEDLIDAFDMLSAPPKKDPSNQDIALFDVERRLMQEADPNAECTLLLELNYSKDIDPRQDTMVHGVFWSLKASWFSRRLMKAGTRNMLLAQISCLVLKR